MFMDESEVKILESSDNFTCILPENDMFVFGWESERKL
jgi:hypothetical protein